MLNQEFASKCLREFQEDWSEDKTLREFLSTYMGDCGIDDEDIESAISDEYVDLIDSWANDNDMDYTEIFKFIMESLDKEVEYDIRIDMGYDEKPTKSGPDSKQFWNKEVRFELAAVVDNIRLECDELFREYEV